jgi:hypothetical protein
MKKLKKISYLYFASGIILSLYAIVSQNKQTLNIDDTYYVFFAKDFAFFVLSIYFIIGIVFLAVEKYADFRIKVFQYLMFNIPFIYYIFSDLINHNNPGYYLAHPIAFKWEVVYIPVTLYLTFLTSLLILISLIVFSVFKMITNKKAST